MRLTWLRDSRYRVAQQPEEVQPAQGRVLLLQGAPRGALARTQAKLCEGYTADGHSSERGQVTGSVLRLLVTRCSSVCWVCDATASAGGPGSVCAGRRAIVYLFSGRRSLILGILLLYICVSCYI
jgi:hypothetical protein